MNIAGDKIMKQMQKPLHRMLAIFLSCIIGIAWMPSSLVDAQDAEGDTIDNVETDDSYATYYEQISDKPWSSDTITLTAGDMIDTAGTVWALEQVNGTSCAILREGEAGGFFQFDISTAGRYQISLDYHTIPGSSGDLEFALYVNDTLLFPECAHLRLNRCYINEADPFDEDVLGNQIRPPQMEKYAALSAYLTDKNGYYSEPYAFYFEAGSYTVELRAVEGSFGIIGLTLAQPETVKTYEQVWQEYQQSGYQAATQVIRIEGESAVYKSDSTLYPTSDRLSAAVSPADPARTKLNTIGQTNWKNPGQTLTFTVDVEEAGLYAIAFRVKQNVHRGMISTRKMTVDGAVPYQELEQIVFPFAIDWYVQTAGTGEVPYALYLTAEQHTITLEVSTGVMASVLRRTEEYVYELNTLYRKILMITGSTPDTYRDYNLDTAIPGLVEMLEKLSADLKAEVDGVEAALGQSGTELSLLLEVAEQLDSFADKPASIPSRLDAFKSNISSLGTWLTGLREQPLELDYIELYPIDAEAPTGKCSLWEELAFGVRAFISSFVTDYNMVGVMEQQKEEATSITAWINAGRDQAQIVRRMIDDEFTPHNGIAVVLNLVSSADTLVQATLADKGPDVALLVSSDLPVNLAKRGALYELSSYEGFAEIQKRFHSSAFIKYQYKDGIYALPNTQEFMMMFYRKDVFAELGLQPPSTWEELYEILPQIMRKNMTVGIPADQGVFEMLLYQKGGTLFVEDLSSTALDTTEALDAFKMWTRFYTDHSFPLSFDFYNRFRTGEMPIGLASYNMYNTLATLAPELDGLWEMLPVPGTVQEDGSCDRTVTSSGLASVIMNDAEDKASCLRFLDWWTSDASQTRYGLELESMLGASGRYSAANLGTIAELPWDPIAYDALMVQMESITATPQLPSSYEISRNINNAFRMVVYNGENERETLNKYATHMDEEIARKNAQRGS